MIGSGFGYGLDSSGHGGEDVNFSECLQFIHTEPVVSPGLIPDGLGVGHQDRIDAGRNIDAAMRITSRFGQILNRFCKFSTASGIDNFSGLQFSNFLYYFSTLKVAGSQAAYRFLLEDTLLGYR